MMDEGFQLKRISLRTVSKNDMAADRIACQVLFCKRTGSADKFAGEEIICGKCWRHVSQATKVERQKLRRRSKRVDRLLMRSSIGAKPDIDRQIDRMARLYASLNLRNWAKCKKEANEVAAGIRGTK